MLLIVARELASHLRLKQRAMTAITTFLQSGEGTGFSSEIETLIWWVGSVVCAPVARELASHLRLKLPRCSASTTSAGSGEGTGFSSEIETPIEVAAMLVDIQVARELASHLRLKQRHVQRHSKRDHCGEGTGFSSEIETICASAQPLTSPRGEGTGFSSEIETRQSYSSLPSCLRVARELASHLRLKPGTTCILAQIALGGEGTGFSSEIETTIIPSCNALGIRWRGNWLLI